MKSKKHYLKDRFPYYCKLATHYLGSAWVEHIIILLCIKDTRSYVYSLLKDVKTNKMVWKR